MPGDLVHVGHTVRTPAREKELGARLLQDHDGVPRLHLFQLLQESARLLAVEGQRQEIEARAKVGEEDLGVLLDRSLVELQDDQLRFRHDGGELYAGGTRVELAGSLSLFRAGCGNMAGSVTGWEPAVV